MEKVYENMYGRVCLLVAEKVLEVAVIRAKHVSEEYSLTLEELEQIALISDNERLQPVIQIPFKEYKGSLRGILLFHHSASTVSLCKIKELRYALKASAESVFDALSKQRMTALYGQQL